MRERVEIKFIQIVAKGSGANSSSAETGFIRRVDKLKKERR